ncbi:MAG TPA: UrcA family protein [Steroidobacteraceae bacterium]|nr:UrcA family protein [Steroidobacteraceae bacterium]
MDRFTLPGRTSLFTAAGLTLLAAVSLLVSPALRAAPIPLQRVQVSDLDLATPKGQRILEKRIGAAIEAVCVHPNRDLPRSRAVVQGIDACRAAALGSVRRQLADLGFQPGVRAVQTRRQTELTDQLGCWGWP